MWELDHKEAECQRIDAFGLWCWRRLLRVPWASRRSNQSILNEIKSEYSVEGLMLNWGSNICPPDMESWLIRKIPDAGKDGRQKENGMTEDVMVGWHHWLSGHEFEQAPGDGKGQGSLACSSPWGGRVGHSWANEQQSCPFIFLLVYLWKKF